MHPCHLVSTHLITFLELDICKSVTVSWAQFKQLSKSQSRDYQNMMGDTTLDHYHHIWKSYQIGSSMKIFKNQIFIIYLIFSYENSATYEHFDTILIFSHSIVHRWHCFHMKIWDIKQKIRAIQDLTFLTSHDFSKINELSNHHVQTKTHHMKLLLGLNSYRLEIPKIVHCAIWDRWSPRIGLSMWN